MLIFLPPTRESQVSESHLQALAEANNRFALHVYKELADSAGKRRNLVFSPLGVSTALAMTLLGAQGKYPDQLKHVLRLDTLDVQTLYPSIRTLLNIVQTEEDIFHVKSKSFLNEKHNYSKQFEVDSRLFFRSQPERLDLSQTQTAEKHISEWAARETGRPVQKLLKPETLERRSDSVLASAASLAGKWEYRIKDSWIKGEGFYTLTSGKGLTVHMLNQRGAFPYAAVTELDCQVAELPLAGNKLKMVIVLPRARDGLLKLEETLDFEHLKLLRNTQETMMDILLPKFALQESHTLEEVIKSMGVKKLVLPTQDTEVEVSHVIHNALVEISEDGIKEAADVQQIPSTRVIVTRPFVFYVQHVESSAIVLMGRVVEPTVAPPSPASQSSGTSEHVPREEL